MNVLYPTMHTKGWIKKIDFIVTPDLALSRIELNIVAPWNISQSSFLSSSLRERREKRNRNKSWITRWKKCILTVFWMPLWSPLGFGSKIAWSTYSVNLITTWTTMATKRFLWILVRVFLKDLKILQDKNPCSNKRFKTIENWSNSRKEWKEFVF